MSLVTQNSHGFAPQLHHHCSHVSFATWHQSGKNTTAVAVPSLLCVCVFPHLQGGALVREGGAEEGGDDAHDDLGHVLLQDGVRVLPVAGVVAGLQHKPEQGQEQLTKAAERGIAHFHMVLVPAVQ